MLFGIGSSLGGTISKCFGLKESLASWSLAHELDTICFTPLVFPWMFPSEKYRSIFFRAVHELDPMLDFLYCAGSVLTKNHMEAPRSVAE